MSTPAEAPTTNGTTGPKPKEGGRIATLEAEVKTLRRELDETRWCFAELIHSIKMARAKQVLNTPEVQERLQSMMVGHLFGGGTANPDVGSLL